MGLAGTGAIYLSRDKSWIRPLLSLVNASDQGKLSPLAVADYLAGINHKVSLGIEDQSIGPRCIVAWRNRKKRHHTGGGAHRFYTEDSRDSNSPSLPTIATGIDVDAIARVLMPHLTKLHESMLNDGTSEILDEDRLDEDLSNLPDEPDEELR